MVRHRDGAARPGGPDRKLRSPAREAGDDSDRPGVAVAVMPARIPRQRRAHRLLPRPWRPAAAHPRRPVAQPPAARPGPDVELLALPLLTILVLGWYAADLGGRTAQVALCWAVLPVLHLWMVHRAWQVARLPGTPEAARRFWRTLGWTGLIYLAGDLVQVAAVIRAPGAPTSATGVSLQTLAVDVGTTFLVAVMLTSPLGFRSRRERLRFWLDTATVMVAAAAFGWYLTIAPDTSRYSSGHLLRGLHDVLLGPVVMLVGMFAVVKLLLSGNRSFTRAAGLLAATAAGVEGVALGIQSELVAGHRLASVFALTVLANALLAGSAAVAHRQVSAHPELLRAVRKRHFSILPYAAIVAVYSLLVVVLHRTGLDLRAWLVLDSALASTVLVVVRQLAAFAENAQLLAELDAKVRERDALAAELHRQAFHDGLTGLANRALFTNRLETALERTRMTGGHLAVMVIDLDDFKPVNDLFGHDAGDGLLVEVAARIAMSVRDTDTVARLGGDEFAVLLEQPLTDGVAAVAGRIVSALSAPVALAHGQVSVGASVGAVVDCGGQREAGELLREADIAMYTAKRQGKGSFEITPDRTEVTGPGY